MSYCLSDNGTLMPWFASRVSYKTDHFQDQHGMETSELARNLKKPTRFNCRRIILSLWCSGRTLAWPETLLKFQVNIILTNPVQSQQYSIKQEQCVIRLPGALLSQSLKKPKKRKKSTPKEFLIFQEMELSSSKIKNFFIFTEMKLLAHIFLLFQEGTFRAQKIKKHTLKRFLIFFLIF